MVTFPLDERGYPGTSEMPHQLTSILMRNHERQNRNPAVTEDQSIRKAQKGDITAFNELVLIYQDRVFRQALWILHDDAAAEDACQETFLRAYRSIHTFRGGPFRPWLLRIATNYCIDQIRTARRRPVQPLTPSNSDGEEIEPSWLKDPGDPPEKQAERTETIDEIFRSIQKLAPEFRVPIILVDLQDMNYAEASAVLQLPLSTFKSRLWRARRKLREDLSKRTGMIGRTRGKDKK
jgi:RNA polymerase sigma-70 factor, ECF subfamily